jgi:hypothetical protein
MMKNKTICESNVLLTLSITYFKLNFLFRYTFTLFTPLTNSNFMKVNLISNKLINKNVANTLSVPQLLPSAAGAIQIHAE